MTCQKTVCVYRSVVIHHNHDGRLDAYLWNRGVTRATAHYCFTIVNREHDKSLAGGDGSAGDSSHSKTVILFEGYCEELFPVVCEDALGCMLCPAARVNDPAEGFLESGYFLVRAEIRLKLQDNERWTVSVERKTATCVVRSTSPLKHNDV